MGFVIRRSGDKTSISVPPTQFIEQVPVCPRLTSKPWVGRPTVSVTGVGRSLHSTSSGLTDHGGTLLHLSVCPIPHILVLSSQVRSCTPASVPLMPHLSAPHVDSPSIPSPSRQVQGRPQTRPPLVPPSTVCTYTEMLLGDFALLQVRSCPTDGTPPPDTPLVPWIPTGPNCCGNWRSNDSDSLPEGDGPGSTPRGRKGWGPGRHLTKRTVV